MDSPVKEVWCPNTKCKTDILQTGFVVASVTYQAFIRVGDRLIKCAAKPGGLRTAACMLCNTPIHVDVNELKRAA